MNYIKHLFYWLLIARSSGLKERKSKPTDYKTSDLGWFDYKPKHKEHTIPTKSVKNQKQFLTCQWCACAVQKEADESEILSQRSLVIKGKEMGLVGRLGLSNVESGQVVLKKWGILTEATCPNRHDTNWTNYLNFPVNDHTEEAAKHKIKSYWFVDSTNDIYKLIDKGRIVLVGMPWYSGFNMKGGFRAPWIISKIIGYYVGGHAFIVKGYDKSNDTFICQNSYGERWGLGGDFSVTPEYLQKYALNRYGGVVNLDEDKVDDPWVKEAKTLYERVKNKYVWLMRADNNHELYEFDDEGLHYVRVLITRTDGKKPKAVEEFNSFLKSNSNFTGISEKDFELLSKYLKLKGLKLGEKNI